MAKVSNNSVSGNQSLRAVKPYDPTPPKKPNRKFQLALQSLNKQIDRPKPRHTEHSETRDESFPDPRNEPRASYSNGARTSTSFDTNRISFVRSSPKVSPPETPSSEVSRAVPAAPSGYRSSPLSHVTGSSKGLSFVRGSRAEKDKLRLSESKDPPALASSRSFIRSISGLNSQRSKPSGPSTPYSRPTTEHAKPRSSAIVRLKPSSATSSSDVSPPQASPPEHKPPVLKDKVGVTKPAVSILDRLGTSKRKMSRSPSPDKLAKREKLVIVPKPKPVPRITSRLGPMSTHPSKVAATASTQVVRARPTSIRDPSTNRFPGHSRPEFTWRQPTRAPYHKPPTDYTLHVNHGYNHGFNNGYNSYNGNVGFSMPKTTVPHPYGQPNYVYTFIPANYRRCIYFPRCTRNDCIFFHPTKNCANGSDCRLEECLFIHPADIEPVMCKYDAKCTREDCTYEHKERRYIVGNSCGYLPVKCKGECPGRSCIKLHPGDLLPHQNTPCIFQHRCNRPPCFFLHYSTFRKNTPKKEIKIPLLIELYQSYMPEEED